MTEKEKWLNLVQELEAENHKLKIEIDERTSLIKAQARNILDLYKELEQKNQQLSEAKGFIFGGLENDYKENKQ